MVAKKRKNKGQLSLKLGLNDERVPKLFGILSLFLSIYLFIAFTSYLFTWKTDQDRVLRFSWGLLLESGMEMANWLGRLGAIVSNMFFYWGFGLPSYFLIAILVVGGLALVRRQPLRLHWPRFRLWLLLMLVSSVFLEFLAGGAAFPWGGAFGEGVSDWLLSFVGTAGMIILLLFLVLGVVVWNVNPNFNEMTPQGAVRDSVQYINDWLTGRLPGKSRKESGQGSALATLRPGERNRENDEDEELSVQERAQPSSGDGRKQLAFELPDDVSRQKPESLKVGDAELEIDSPSGEPVPSESGPGPGISGPTGPKLSFQEENQDHSEPYDPTLELSSYEFPVTSLLKDYSDQRVEIDRAELEANKDQIIETLLNYKIEITKIRATIGPTVTLYEIIPAPGVRISKIKNLEDDIALSLAALGIRIIAPIPGRGTIGIEVPNKNPQVVSMKEVLQSEKFKRAKMDLPIALGKTISNEVFVADLAKMPHLLVAGATGQGKSVGVNAIIMSLLYKKHPSQVKLVLVDPKKVELFPYSKLEHHFLAFLPGQNEPITTETSRVIHTLNSLCIEMDQRYNLLKKAAARNIREYNEKFVQRRLNPNKGHRFLPFIVLVIDEFADMIMTAGKEVELPIGRLAQLARAVGIHLIIATQRPSVNIITGVIKANFPARIAYKVSSKVDSRTILDGGGADQLIGRGDMLLSVSGETKRIQGAFVDTPEVEEVVDFISSQRGYPEPFFLPEFHGDDEEIQGAQGLTYAELDEMFEDAARLIVQNQHGSTSMIQRRLKLGYNRAGRIMDQLEALGIVGPSEGSKAREVLIYDEIELEKYLEDIRNRK
ncbi:MAG: DNA translocase FtsK [Lewinellaceae bacterium]|nr:DNA translocase FtsK [Lewinellaceae bacterium]MCB9289559.1 DNA translocase FtsK [Lewinellaceae bacterium]